VVIFYAENEEPLRAAAAILVLFGAHFHEKIYKLLHAFNHEREYNSWYLAGRCGNFQAG
jgi:hypothetical protein